MSPTQHLTHHLLTERNGKTLHLLKANSKPVASGRKRKKIMLLGTYEQYTESKKKPGPQPAHGPSLGNLPISSLGEGAQIHSGANSITQYMAPAPKAKDPKNANK